jgi:hypothetical protein
MRRQTVPQALAGVAISLVLLGLSKPGTSKSKAHTLKPVLQKAPCCHITGVYGCYKYYKFDSIAVMR